MESLQRSPGVPASLLLTDLYQLNMMQAYFDAGLDDTAVFEFFVRKLPAQRNFLVAAGVEQALAFLEGARFTEEELDWLAASGRFTDDFLAYLRELRFTGDVDAVAEGTIVFPNEPILRVTAPMPVAQLVETRLINLLHTSVLVASKAARMRLAAPEAQLVDFGLRRAHGAEAGLLAARAAYVAGFDATATVPAQPMFAIPIAGTMAHSYVEAHDSELAAFRSFARARPDDVVLLIDTYDTVRAAHKVVALAPELAREGIAIKGVRIDSGDLDALSRRVREILDAGGLADVQVMVSGGLDEWKLRRLVRGGAPIAGYGIGTALTTSEDAPALDCAYKLQEYAGTLRRKLSSGKATWPGRKQVWRRTDADGCLAGDTLGFEDETEVAGTPLLQPAMRAGARAAPAPTLAQNRATCSAGLAALPDGLRKLDPAPEAYPVTIHQRLNDAAARLADEIGRRSRDETLPNG